MDQNGNNGQNYGSGWQNGSQNNGWQNGPDQQNSQNNNWQQNGQNQWNGENNNWQQNNQNQWNGQNNNWQQNNQNQWNNQNNGWQGGSYNQPQQIVRQPIFQNGMLNRPLLKAEAKAIFKAHYGNMFLASFLPGVIGTAVALIPYIGGVISWLFAPILTVGGIFLALEIIRGYQAAQAGDIFKPFNRFGDVFGAVFTTQLFTALWGLLLVIPGIYKGYCWYMVPYLIADNPDLSGSQAREISNRMMEGHKWELFVLQLSFIGWYLLSAVTFGIVGLFYVNPWIFSTLADYYDNLKMLDEANMQNQWNAQNYQNAQNFGNANQTYQGPQDFGNTSQTNQGAQSFGNANQADQSAQNFGNANQTNQSAQNFGNAGQTAQNPQEYNNLNQQGPTSTDSNMPWNTPGSGSQPWQNGGQN